MHSSYDAKRRLKDAATITYGIESFNLGIINNNYTINRLDYIKVLLLWVNFIFANLLKVIIKV